MHATRTPPATHPAETTVPHGATTESVVRNHLATFLAQKGIPAIVADYHPAARFHSPSRSYEGPAEIGEFFASFIRSLPTDAYDRFTLRGLRVDGELAFITWSIGDDVPLGTDTFVVRDGSIVAQTFAMHSRDGDGVHNGLGRG